MKITSSCSSSIMNSLQQRVSMLQAQLSGLSQIIAQKLQLGEPINVELEMSKQLAEELGKAMKELQKVSGTAPIETLDTKLNIDTDSNLEKNTEKLANSVDNHLIQFDIR